MDPALDRLEAEVHVAKIAELQRAAAAAAKEAAAAAQAAADAFSSSTAEVCRTSQRGRPRAGDRAAGGSD
jgi:hypothetical protein